MRPKSLNIRSTDRALTLLAVLAVSVYAYGLRILLLSGIAAVTAMTAELVCLYLRGIPFRLHHLDAALAGVLTVMLMPPTVSVSLVIMSVIFAIIIGRQIFGGRENPVIPPAAAGYCFALLNSRAEMTMFPAEKTVLPLWNASEAAVSEGLSSLWNRTGDFPSDSFRWLTGLPAQQIGTVSLLLLGVIALVLLLRRSASVWVFLPMTVILILGNIVFNSFHNPAAAAVGSCLTNQAFFAVIYLFSDPDHAPPHLGGIAYGMIAGMSILILTRIFYVTDAPVLLAVLLSPVSLACRHVLRQKERAGTSEKGGDGALASS